MPVGYRSGIVGFGLRVGGSKCVGGWCGGETLY